MFAAHFGMGLAFAHFINPIGGPEAVAAYRERFQPSEDQPKEQAAVAIFAFCSENEEKINQHKAMMDYRFNQFEKGGGLTPVSYEDIKDLVYSPAEQDRILHNRKRVVTGNPEQIKTKLINLAADYKVDELILATIAEDFDDRLNSYKLLAEMFCVDSNFILN